MRYGFGLRYGCGLTTASLTLTMLFAPPRRPAPTVVPMTVAPLWATALAMAEPEPVRSVRVIPIDGRYAARR